MPEEPRKRYYGARPKFGDSKTTSIEKAITRKETSIATYTDKKEAGIVISGAIRDAFMWCVNHPQWGDDSLTDEQRRAWIDKVARENIAYIANNRSNLESYYHQLQSATDEIAFKAREEADISAIETIDDPSPAITDFGEEDGDVKFDI